MQLKNVIYSLIRERTLSRRAHSDGFYHRQVWREWFQWRLEVRPLEDNWIMKMDLSRKRLMPPKKRPES